MRYLDEETKKLVFELKDTWTSDEDVREIVELMADPNGKYEEVRMDMTLVNYFLENYKPEEERNLLKSKVYKLKPKDFIPYSSR